MKFSARPAKKRAWKAGDKSEEGIPVQRFHSALIVSPMEETFRPARIREGIDDSGIISIQQSGIVSIQQSGIISIQQSGVISIQHSL